jgi:FAD/FMN-containing dehydrogenase
VTRADDRLLARLVAIVGAAHVITDADRRHPHEVDWTGRFHGEAIAVVRPRSTTEVAEVLARCDGERVGVVPQGGNTGLVGGAVPQAGQIVLDLRRLDDVGPVDEASGQLTAGAGATIAAVAERAAASGLRYAVDLAARDTATVGGTIATNAGGCTSAPRHHPAQVLGIRPSSPTGGSCRTSTGS